MAKRGVPPLLTNSFYRLGHVLFAPLCSVLVLARLRQQQMPSLPASHGSTACQLSPATSTASLHQVPSQLQEQQSWHRVQRCLPQLLLALHCCCKIAAGQLYL
jgi:hypothetical protein